MVYPDKEVIYPIGAFCESRDLVSFRSHMKSAVMTMVVVKVIIILLRPDVERKTENVL